MSLLHFRFNERRRTLRVTLTVGLTVKWQTEKGEKFSVKTSTLSVSREGGLFPMEEPVVVGQLLNVHNENSGKSIECKVTTIRKARDGKTYVGMEFVAPQREFLADVFSGAGNAAIAAQFLFEFQSFRVNGIFVSLQKFPHRHHPVFFHNPSTFDLASGIQIQGDAAMLSAGQW